MNRAARLDYCWNLIAEHGWMVQGGHWRGQPVAYTVGLTAARRAELLLAGHHPEDATIALNDLARHHLAVPLRPGQPYPAEGVTGLLVPHAMPPSALGQLRTCTALYGPRVTGLELRHAP